MEDTSEKETYRCYHPISLLRKRFEVKLPTNIMEVEKDGEGKKRFMEFRIRN